MKNLKRKNITFLVIACILIYSLQVVFHITQNDAIEEIAILGFHNVVYDEEKEAYYKTNMWVDSLSAFEEKMRYLYEQGYQTISMDEFYEWKKGNLEVTDKSVVITFDDGYYASSYLIPQILEKYGFCASTFVVGSAIEGDHVWDASVLQYVNLQDMKDSSIMKYYSHTYAMHEKINTNFAFDIVSKQQMQEDFDLQNKIVDTSYFAYPFGYYNDAIIEVLQQNDVRLAFGYNENRKAKRNGDDYTIPRFAITAYTNMEVFKAMLES